MAYWKGAIDDRTFNQAMRAGYKTPKVGNRKGQEGTARTILLAGYIKPL